LQFLRLGTILFTKEKKIAAGKFSAAIILRSIIL